MLGDHGAGKGSPQIGEITFIEQNTFQRARLLTENQIEPITAR